VSQPRVYKAQAVVLKRISFGETDRILTLFTLEHGKLSAIAKGARRSVSRIAAATEPLTHSRMLLAMGQNLDVLTQGEVKEAFHDIRCDLTKIAYASYFTEFVIASVEERQPNPELFHLLLSALYMLQRTEMPDLVARLFELQALRILGYEPELRQCVRDRAPLTGQSDGTTGQRGDMEAPSGHTEPTDRVREAARLEYAGAKGASVGAAAVGLGFHPARGGALCARCAAETPATLPMSGAALELMRRLIEAEPAALSRLCPTEKQRAELAGLLVPYVRQRCESALRSLGFIEELRVAPPDRQGSGSEVTHDQ
jgi:DNA repair protein RecO (recombination protein O)